MGRISQYEQSKLPSSVTGYTMPDSPYAAVAEKAGQQIATDVTKYEESARQRVKQLASLEAQNAFNDFRSSYAGIVEQAESKGKSAKSKDIDAYKENLIQEKQRLASQNGAKLSDEAKRDYEAMIAQFNESDGAHLEKWSVSAKYESVGREGLAGISATTDQVGATNTIDDFEQGLKKTYSMIENYAKSYPVDTAKLTESARKMATTKFIANAIEKDPDAATAMLSAANSPILKYIDTNEQKSFLVAAKTQSEYAAVGQKFDNDMSAIATAASLSSASKTSGASFGSLVAEYNFLPKDSIERTIHEDVFRGNSVPQKSDQIQDENFTSLIATASGINKSTGKVTNATKMSKYLGLVAKAHEMFREGDISEKQKNLIVKLADKKYSFDGKTTNFANTYAQDDDPREYILHRGLEDLQRNTTFKKKPKVEQRAILNRFATQLFEAIDVKTENDPEKYNKLRKNMFASQEAKDKNYQYFVAGLTSDATGKQSYTGYNLLSRAIHGNMYQDVYVDPKTNVEYPIVAYSRTGKTYAQYSKKYAQELEKR